MPATAEEAAEAAHTTCKSSSSKAITERSVRSTGFKYSRRGRSRTVAPFGAVVVPLSLTYRVKTSSLSRWEKSENTFRLRTGPQRTAISPFAVSRNAAQNSGAGADGTLGMANGGPGAAAVKGPVGAATGRGFVINADDCDVSALDKRAIAVDDEASAGVVLPGFAAATLCITPPAVGAGLGSRSVASDSCGCCCCRPDCTAVLPWSGVVAVVPAAAMAVAVAETGMDARGAGGEEAALGAAGAWDNATCGTGIYDSRTKSNNDLAVADCISERAGDDDGGSDAGTSVIGSPAAPACAFTFAFVDASTPWGEVAADVRAELPTTAAARPATWGGDGTCTAVPRDGD